MSAIEILREIAGKYNGFPNTVVSIPVALVNRVLVEYDSRCEESPDSE